MNGHRALRREQNSAYRPSPMGSLTRHSTPYGSVLSRDGEAGLHDDTRAAQQVFGGAKDLGGFSINSISNSIESQLKELLKAQISDLFQMTMDILLYLTYLLENIF